VAGTPQAPDGAPPSSSPARSGAPESGRFSHRRLTLNSLSNVSRYVFAIVISFFLTPFTINAVGNAAYGTWLVLLAVLGYATILELGIQRAIVKMVAENSSLGDEERMNRLIATAFYFFLLAGGVIALILAFPIQALLDSVITDPGWRELPRWMFLLLGADAAFVFLNYVFTGVVYGWQLYHAKNLVDLGSFALNALLLVLFLKGGGLPVLLLVKVTVDLLVLVAAAAIAKHAFPGLNLDVRRVSPASFRELISFAGRVFISSTMYRVATNAQPIIIGARLSTEATAFFGVPRRLVDYGRQMHWALATGFMPAFSDLHRRAQTSLMRSVYMRYSRYLLLIMMPVIVLILAYGPAFMRLWVGPEYAREGTWVLYFLTAAYLVELAQPLLWSLFIGVGRLNLLTTVSSVGSGVTIVGTLLLVGRYGISGVAFTFFAVFLIQQAIFTASLCRFFTMSFLSFAREVYLGPAAAGILAAGLAWGAGTVAGRGSYSALAGGSAGVIAAYGTAVYAFILDRSERAWLRAKGKEAWAGATGR
jgi:O-antigen/teichoic acid export membrane protein